MMCSLRILIPVLLLSVLAGCNNRIDTVDMTFGEGVPNQGFLENKLTAFFDQSDILLVDHNPEFRISILRDSAMEAESYRLDTGEGTIEIVAPDEAGLAYGCYELMQQVRFKGSLYEVQPNAEEPRFPFRAIKFNMPYMAYRSDASMAQHDHVCRDLDFWERYLDMMVENRFNVLSLWSLHLYQYMVIPDKYPEASQFSEVEMAQWKKFWTTLFRMADERGIDTYIINWNTFVSPSFARANHVAEYSEIPAHFGPGDESLLVEDYTREIIRQVIDEYPSLDGLGITLGERMGGMTTDERRAWLDRTIFQGMRDANRKIKFVYRAPLSANRGSGGSTSEENDLATRRQIESLDTEGPVWLEFKYNWSHGHSSPHLFIVHGGKLTDKYRNPVPEKYNYVWTVRNEDFFVHRWGQPDFIREFIANNGHNYVGGCFIGSEVFIPALDYTSKEGPHKTWDYSFERLWLWYSMWGRMLYNPDTPDELFIDLLKEKYGEEYGETAFEAWRQASKVPLMFASFHQGRNDLSLYTEGFTGYREHGKFRFFDIEGFGSHQVLDTIRYINVNDFISRGDQVPEGVLTPPELADSLDQIGDVVLGLVKKLRKKDPPPPVDCELADLEAWSWYARYFADKVRASVALTRYRRGMENSRNEAVDYLRECERDWRRYADATTKYNRDEFLFHTEKPFSWTGMMEFVKQDIELAQRKNEELPENEQEGKDD